MATMLMQRDLVVTLKKETTANLEILSKIQPLPVDLSRMIFKDHALEKPTQNVFNHLSFYLISLIDANICASLSWPLYDSTAERAFRNDVAKFVCEYSNKGLLSPVMSSYLVNPGCYKVTLLMFQMSQLAVNQALVSLMNEGSKKKYDEMAGKYKTEPKDEFVVCIEKETAIMHSKLSKFLYKRDVLETIAAKLRKKIVEMETKLATTKAQHFIDNLVDGFLKTHKVDEKTKTELLKIKNVHENSKIFDTWLIYVDTALNDLECTWDAKVTPLLVSCQNLQCSSETLLLRQTGAIDRSTYTLEYNHKTDEICTKALESQVNSEQKYVLRNLTKDGKLSFPNLIKAFVISIGYILKDVKIGDEIYSFNKYLEGGKRKYADIVSEMRKVMVRIQKAEDRLQATPVQYKYSYTLKNIPEIRPLPDLSNLKATIDSTQLLFNTFTPLHSQRYQFNLRRKNSSDISAKSQFRSLITPLHIAPRADFFKSVTTCKKKYDHVMDSHNLTVKSHVNRANETVSECATGFTKEQIQRLLSTKKSSSSKKFKFKTDRLPVNVKKGALFNESVSEESRTFFRSQSSPNLFETKEKSYHTKGVARKLSTMQENRPVSILEMSGIAELERDVNFTTPPDYGYAESSRKNLDASSMPSIKVTPTTDDMVTKILNKELNLGKEMGIESIISPILDVPRKNAEHNEVIEVKDETPKTNTRPVKKTSSLEKIINRYRKVRANVLPDKKEELTDFKTITEEKESKHVNGNTFDLFTANRNLLPDLLTPSCNNSLSGKVNGEAIDDLDDIERDGSSQTRQSLGSALGVDQTFLDQFDLID